MDKVKLIISPLLDTYGQMAVDELLVSNFAPCIRFFNWNHRPQATFGYIQKFAQAEEELNGHGKTDTSALEEKYADNASKDADIEAELAALKANM